MVASFTTEGDASLGSMARDCNLNTCRIITASTIDPSVPALEAAHGSADDFLLVLWRPTVPYMSTLAFTTRYPSMGVSASAPTQKIHNAPFAPQTAPLNPSLPVFR
ncbi:hypothetical protein ACJQWK_09572 [Exserohilum turcicum]